MWARLLQMLLESRMLRGPVFKASLLLSTPLFLELAWPEPDHPAARLWLVLAQFVAYLWFAFTVNDLADREADSAAGKRRTLARLPLPVGVLLALALAAACAAVGWALRPPSGYWIVLAIGLALACAYSLPPLWLKRRGFLGILAGPLLGKTVPLLLCCVLWSRWGWWILPVALADLTKNGIDLLFHQLVDEDADRAAGIRSHVVAVGRERASRHLRRLARLGVCASAAVAVLYAWYIPEFRLVCALALPLAPLVWVALRRTAAAALPLTPRALLPLPYLALGGAVFVLGPALLAAILAWRDPGHAPLGALVLALTVVQVRFLWAYRYA